MSSAAAEEQFREQNAWANPQHPINQQHRQKLRQSTPKPSESFITPANQKRAVDLTESKDSASTIAEPTSAPPSSALNTPHEPQTVSVKKERAQEKIIYPINLEETPDHSMTQPSNEPITTSNSTAYKTTINDAANDTRHSPHISRLSLFSSPSRHGPHHASILNRNETNSPLLGQGPRSTSIAAGAGLGRFGI